MSDAWKRQRERGSRWMVVLLIRIALGAGRAFGRLLAFPISLYFLATAPRARASSRAFLTRALGRPATLRDVYTHLYCFGITMLDRAYLLTGRHGNRLRIEVEGEAHLLDALALGRGCLLFGSHLGSFELLGVVGSADRHLPVNVVMHVDSTIHESLAQVGGGLPYRVIALGEPDTMLQVKECLDRGEIVGLLVDRVYGDEATCAMRFLGEAAPFSLAPYRLAAITGAPVVMAYGLYQGGDRYLVSFAPLAERMARNRGEPCEGLSPWVEAYVANLEANARLTPYNWFNFYDYWAARP